jgi:hypothetical protein
MQEEEERDEKECRGGEGRGETSYLGNTFRDRKYYILIVREHRSNLR